VHQAAVLGVALGLATGAGAQLALLLLCGLFLGAAHGLGEPRELGDPRCGVSARIRSMVFSIKQTGVPLGGAIAGLLVPALLLWMSWQAAVLALAIGAAVLLVLVVRHDPADDAARRLERLRLRSFAAPVAEVWANRPDPRARRRFGGVLLPSRSVFSPYLVSYLKLELGYSLVAARRGVASRRSPARLAESCGASCGPLPRAALGPRQPRLVMVVCGGALASLNPAWPQAAVVGVCVLYGATAVGWNGVFLAEVARLAPEGRVAYLTGGTQFFTFAGVLIGPPLFGAIASVTGSYGAGFVVTAALPLLVVVPMLARRGP